MAIQTRTLWRRAGMTGVASAMSLLMLAACGGGGGGSRGGATGTISGTIVNSVDGSPISGAVVANGSDVQVTGADGSYSFTGLPLSDRTVLSVKAAGFAETFQVTPVIANVTSTPQAQLLPVGQAGTVNASVNNTISVAGSTATVIVPANSLVDSNGMPVAGDVNVALTPIDPAANINTMPGDFLAVNSSGGSETIESFGALSIQFTSLSGEALNLGAGKFATVRIPLASRNGTPDAAMPLYYFDATAGHWVQEGAATLQGTAPNQYYEGTVTHFSIWNADKALSTVYVNGCVTGEDGTTPVANATVRSDGIDYSGFATTLTDRNGDFRLAMKASAVATIVATKEGRSSNTVSASNYGSEITLSSCLTMASLANLPTIRLTWGASPTDLDSHLLMPDGTIVYYGSQGSLDYDPFAQLDVDDVTSYGPEVITLRKLMVGTYTYTVDNFSSTAPGISGSPARVEFARGANVNIYAPPVGENVGITNYWTVFSFTVDNACNVSVSTVNTWNTFEPTGATGSGVYCTP